jgi:ComF family protein
MSGGNISNTSTEKFKLIQWFFDCVFPKECVVCTYEGDYWCYKCQNDCSSNYPFKCFGCQKLNEVSGLCRDCQPKYSFDGIIIAADYEDEIIGTIIRTFKYRFIKSLSVGLALILKKKLEIFLQKPQSGFLIDKHFFSAVVIGMPLSNRRQRWREFNQADLLASHIAHFCNLEQSKNFLFREHRKPQAKLSSTERLHNLAESFFVSGSSPELVIIVDDVVTTGASLNEAARALKQAGALEVWGLVVAKG